MLCRCVLPAVLLTQPLSDPRDCQEEQVVAGDRLTREMVLPRPTIFLFLLVSVWEGLTKTGHIGPKQRGQTPYVVPLKCAFPADKWTEGLHIFFLITKKET